MKKGAAEVKARMQIAVGNGAYQCAGINRHEVEDERACAAMLADVPVGESPIGGSAQVPP
jgi:hypothetical protein